MSKRIQFDIKYRPKIESGEYKVETRSGVPVKLLLINGHNARPIIGELELNGETVYISTDENGSWTEGNGENQFDLFIITPEEDPRKFKIKASEFAEAYYLASTDFNSEEYKACDGNLQLIIDKYASELLSLAREQLIKDGYIIKKKAFHDAVENISDKHRAEMSVEYSVHCKVEDGTRHAVMNWKAFQKVAQKFIDIGKAEALKDLPRWDSNLKSSMVDEADVIGQWLYYKEHRIRISDLEKLPGFKED